MRADICGDMSKQKVVDWALSNGFEERQGVGYVKALPFGWVYVDFKGDDIEVCVTAEGGDKGSLMASERQPLWLVGHVDVDAWLSEWIKGMLYKYVDEVWK